MKTPARQSRPHRSDALAMDPARQQSGHAALAANPPAAKALLALQGAIQGSARVAQRQAIAEMVGRGTASRGGAKEAAVQRANNTGLPDQLKSGIESLSGMSMDHVRVHYNSPRPAQLNAHAYSQGSEIHLAPGQARHLPHEAWHVVQQARGRVKPQSTMHGVAINADAALEREADIMGARGAGFAYRDRPAPVQRQAIRVTTRAAQGHVVQCVGGPKFGMEVTGDAATALVAQGLELLRARQAAEKLRIRTAKQEAIVRFNSGDQSDRQRQDDYTAALAAAEMRPEALLASLDGGLTHAGDVISFQGVEIARIRRDAAAYVIDQPANVATSTAAIYKRHTLGGRSAKEYVDVGGLKLRRYAFRGITPPERRSFKLDQPLRPINHGVNDGHMGYNFNSRTGVPEIREPDPNDETKISDLEWLNRKASTSLGQVPNNAAMKAFLQARKGVGKVLSATSTPRAITSNHGAPFTGFGNITIDLAKVPEANFLHHYKQADLSAATLGGGVTRPGSTNHTLEWEIGRANQTVRRNRELMLSEIPSGAVENLDDSPDRKAYEAEYIHLYRPYFNAAYDGAIAASNIDFAPTDRPVPVHFPWHEDHYTQIQARTDFRPSDAQQRGASAAAPKIAYGAAYLQAYGASWTREYENAAWESDFVMDNGATVNEIDVPKPPAQTQLPHGTGTRDGQDDGDLAGAAAGQAAGNNYAG